MKFTHEDLEFLRGKRFSSGLAVRFREEPEDADHRSRTEVLTQLVAGKQVIHVGCVDHGPAGIQRKIARGRWLHQALHHAAARCFGVDIDAEGIRYMRDTLGYSDVAAVNLLEEECPPLMAQRWDYLLLPEVVEHIGDPVRFLSALRRGFGNRIGELVVTVPNAFNRLMLPMARRNEEHINSDHRFWFTPYTLAKVAMDAGFEPLRFLCCEERVRAPSVFRPRSFMKRRALQRYPLLRKSIVMFLAVPTDKPSA
jgi:hypothetical protein